ncbi:MAG: TraB/GumN family protein [Hyphomonadaceae bacterium]|nr:TraB/GumN family protein [Hyphomonadaceae bacterium]
MRTWFFALLAAAASALAACAPVQMGEPALWRIADADSEIYLFGSVHVLPRGVQWLNPRILAALESSDEFVTETDVEAADFSELAQRYGTLPAGETLTERLSADDRERLARAAQETGLDPVALDRLRPWFAALQITYAYAARQGHSTEAGVESVLGARARARNIRFGYLETPEQQIRVLADLAPADEAHFLSVTLRQIHEGGRALSDLDGPWAQGDLETLSRELDRQWAEAGPAIHNALIIERNRAWADAIAERLEGSGSAFITVGAAHLVGDENVVQLLRERGITVEGP